MMKSMTGFGRSQIEEQGYEVVCEIKGVNHRFFDAHIRIPRRYTMLEEKVKELLRKNISRGRLEVNISIDKTRQTSRVIKVDKELAIAYYNSLKDLAENLNISENFKAIDLFRLPDVYNLEDEEENIDIIWTILDKALNDAVDELLEMRLKEGHNLSRDILERNSLILSMVERLEIRSPEVAQEYQDKLQNRIREMISQEFIDDQRIIQEAAIFADKANVTEEIVRLHSHIEHLDELMMNENSAGRKCDFLVQEMFREINTVASKANDIEMSKIVVEVKAELEKIREQLQNLE